MLKNIFIAIVLLSGLISAQHITGNGTANDPYILYTAEHVDSIRYFSPIGLYFKLANDIDLKDYPDWTPIFSVTTPFRGYFDWDGYTIKNMKITTLNVDGTGLFGGIGGDADSVNIENGTLDSVNISISGATVGGSTYLTGTLAGSLGFQQIDRNTVQNFKVTNPKISINVTDSYEFQVGGLAGKSGGNSLANVKIENADLYTKLTSNPTNGNNRGFGGLIGSTSSGAKIRQCFFQGKINYDTTSGGNLFVGGLIGISFAVSTDSLIDSYARIDTILSNYYCGGIIGFSNDLTIRNCYSVVNYIRSSHVAAIDGLVSGYMSIASNVDSTYADTTISNLKRLRGTNSTGATGEARTTMQMKTQSNYGLWDFTNVWTLNESINDSYPYLINNPPFTSTPQPPEIVLPKKWGLIR